MSFGSRIRQLRIDRGWTLEQLSEASGVEVGTLSALEVRNSTRSKYAPEIALALGVPIEQLFRDDGAAAPAAQPLTAAEVDLVAKWRKLFDHQREEFAALLAGEYEKALKVEAEMKRRGYDRFVPDEVVAIHYKPSPPQQELLVTPRAAAKLPKRAGKGKS